MKALFVVLEVDQASGQVDTDQSVTLFDDVRDATEHATELTDYNREVGRRETYRVFELTEVEA
ncbi:hypothetical protein [Micromonospora chersina]